MDDLLSPSQWPQGVTGWCISGVYRSSPFAGSYYPAELAYVPMSRAAEYAQGALMEHRSDVPVLVSLSQRYRILSELILGLQQAVPELSCILVRVNGPDFNIPLPSTLLAADVLLVHDPMAALPPVLASAHQNIGVIFQDLRADGPEPGSNRLWIALLQPHSVAAMAQRLRRMMASQPLLQALSELSLAPIPADAA